MQLKFNDHSLAAPIAPPRSRLTEQPWLAVFFLDQQTACNQLSRSPVRQIERFGFDVLETIHVNGRHQVLRQELRLPVRFDLTAAIAIFVLDVLPRRDGAGEGGLTNGRVAEAVRAFCEAAHPHAFAAGSAGPAVALDGEKAWEAAELLMPGKIAELRRRIEAELDLFHFDEGIGCIPTHGNRAKVELVDWQGTLAVRKVYRQSALRYMQREIEVQEAMASVCPQLVRLLAKGSNYLVMEYVQEGWTLPLRWRWPAPLPLDTVRELAGFVRLCVSNGFDPIDHAPNNNFLFQKNGYRVLDCELWRRCDPDLPPERSLSMSGLPIEDMDGPRAEWTRDPYHTRWCFYTCLGLRSFLHDPPWLQRLKRPFVYSHLALRMVALMTLEKLRGQMQFRALRFRIRIGSSG